MTVHTHAYTCVHTNIIQTVGVKDSITQLKCSEKRNLSSLFLKEGRVVKCPTSELIEAASGEDHC